MVPAEGEAARISGHDAGKVVAERPAEPAGEQLGSWELVLKAVPLVAGAVAATLYGICYQATAVYYERFGLTPKDAGVEQGTLVVRAAAVFGLVVGLLLVVALGAVAASAVDRFLSQRRSLTGHPVLRTMLATVAFLTVGYTLAYLAKSAALVVISTLLVVAPWFAQMSGDISTGRLRPTRGVIVSALALIATLTVISALEIYIRAEQLANDVVADGQADPSHLLVMALGLRTVGLADEDRCAVVLSRNGDRSWLLVRAEDSSKTVKVEPVPTDSLRLSVPVSAPACWNDE